MYVVVVAGGQLPEGGHRTVESVLAHADLILAADSGLTHLRSLDRWPDAILGDLDSALAGQIAAARSRGVQVEEYSPDKDATDLELALDHAVEAGAERFTVLAGFGGRLDHELATIGLLCASKYADVKVSATDGLRHLWVVRESLSLTLEVNTTLSLVPWAGDVDGVTTAGLRWPLRGEPLPLGSTRGVSNICLDSFQRISITSGTLVAIADTTPTSTESTL